MRGDGPISPAPRPAARRHTSEEVAIPTARWCLFLDVDGTLLELAETPGGVRVDTDLQDLLARVRQSLDGAVALVSGRPVADLDRLFAAQRWPAAGVHGLERRDALGSWHVRHVPDEGPLSIARSRLQQLAQQLPGTLFEDKGIAVALHYRQSPQFESRIRRAAGDITREVGGDLQVLEGRQVVELRPGGATKADAIGDFLRESPFCGRLPIFAGDDNTDSDALRLVEHLNGLSVAVGNRVSGMLQVAGPREVRALLEQIAITGAPPP